MHHEVWLTSPSSVDIETEYLAWRSVAWVGAANLVIDVKFAVNLPLTLHAVE